MNQDCGCLHSEAHVEVTWDGTVGKNWTKKDRDSDETGHWLFGCIGLTLSMEDGTRSREATYQ